MRPVLAVPALLAVLALASPAPAQTLSFDGMTSATAFSIPTATRTFMGQAVNLSAGSTTLVTGIDIVLISVTAQAYTNLRLNVQLWGGYTGSATPIFTSAAGSAAFNFGANTLAANTAYTITALNFSSPIDVGSLSNVGITLNWQGDTGAGLASTDNLTTAVRGGASASAITVGSNAAGDGYYRNASGRTDFNFASTDLRTIGTNSALAVRLYTTPVPEPVGLFAAGAGLVGAARLARRRRGAAGA